MSGRSTSPHVGPPLSDEAFEQSRVRVIAALGQVSRSVHAVADSQPVRTMTWLAKYRWWIAGGISVGVILTDMGGRSGVRRVAGALSLLAQGLAVKSALDQVVRSGSRPGAVPAHDHAGSTRMTTTYRAEEAP